MSEMEFTKLSSKGQIVIPQEIREGMKLKPGTPFAVIEQKDLILLKKIEMPKIKSWAEVTKPFREAKKKIKESEVNELIHKLRKNK